MPNLSQIKRQRMIEFLEKLRSEHTDDESIRAFTEIENHIRDKKYGLVWEEHSEHVDEMLKENIPIFTEVTKKKITAVPDGKYNFILEGDNLQSLYLLEKTHRGLIDLIYIDPPYNRGQNDFIYDDNYIDKTDTFRHSKWLSFMTKRLNIARNLLSENGVIFISIDDNEDATLKLLCDEIFGEDCFVANISWQRTYSTRNDSKGIPAEIEYLLVYSKKTDWNPLLLERTENMNAKYKNPDNDTALWRTDNAYAADAATHQGMVYAIQHPFTGAMLYPASGLHWRYKQSEMLDIMRGWCDYELRNLDDAEKRANVCGIAVENIKKDVLGIVLSESLEISREKAQTVYNRGQWPKYFFTKKGYGGIAKKTYLDSAKGRLPSNFWSHLEVGHTDEAKKELKALFEGGVPFDTPKPTRLIERILQIASTKNCTILDFFAGSGTTAQAVIEFNRIDGGKRRFILCTDNQNNICENVTYPRVSKVINGYSFTGKKVDILFEKKLTLKGLQDAANILNKAKKVAEDNKENYKRVTTNFKDGLLKVTGEWDTTEGVEGIPANVKYFKCDWTPRKPEEYLLSNALCLHIKEMIELQNAIEVDNVKNVLILNKAEFQRIVLNDEAYNKIENIWVNQNIVFNTAEIAKLKALHFKYIPKEFFGQELREAAE